MRPFKGLRLPGSGYKKRSWHLIFTIGLILLLGMLSPSCEKENEGENAPSDEYYVKYEVNSTTIYLGRKLDVTLNTEKNELMTMTIDQRKLSETVIGPVEKGFKATLKVVAAGETHDKLKLYTKIYVSKNDSPFALKKNDGSDTPRDFVQLSYTIDY